VAVNAAGTALVVTDSANGQALVYKLQSSSAGNVTNGLVCTGQNTGVDSSGSTAASGCTAPAAVTVGNTPVGVAIDGTNAFVANEGSANVTVIDPPADLAIARDKDQAGANGTEKLTRPATQTRKRTRHTRKANLAAAKARIAAIRLHSRREPLVAPIRGRIGS
jgi:DNA-binding beta-propeller fold protein YncE